MAKFTGRILPLLWRHAAPARRPAGRPPRLSVDAVVAAGIRIADADGLEAASMARVAADLQVATMTLYTYVPSRADLVDLMVDEVLGARRLLDDRTTGWRPQVELFAERTRAMYVAHPWLTEVSLIRPPLGPGMLAEREFMIAAVSGLGVPVDRVNRVALAVTALVYAFAREAGEDERLRRVSGQSTDAWWLERTELWDDWFDQDRHPAMTALWNAGGFEQDQDAAAYALDLLLTGIERSVE